MTQSELSCYLVVSLEVASSLGAAVLGASLIYGHRLRQNLDVP